MIIHVVVVESRESGPYLFESVELADIFNDAVEKAGGTCFRYEQEICDEALTRKLAEREEGA